MSDNFSHLPKEMQRALLEGAANKLNVRAIVLEKDIWLCWALKQLFTLPLIMTFKGGTSLSKAFNLIERFSEDVDITIDYKNFIAEEKLNQIKSRTAFSKLNEYLKDSVRICVQNTVLPHLRCCLIKDFPNIHFQIALSENGEELKIYYPSLFNTQNAYLENQILVEFGGRNTTEPSSSHEIKTLLSQVVTGLYLPVAKAQVLSPLKTFWEKATLIHVECNRNRVINSPERLSRHWYDLAVLASSWVGVDALQAQDLLENVIQHKKVFFNASYANYDACLNGGFKLIPNEDGIKGLKSDFTKMQEAGMFQKKETISFDEIIKILTQLEKNINEN